MAIELKRLTEVSIDDIVALMNDPLVRRQMPLTSDDFNAANAARFVAAKERLWAEHGYGPWAFVVDGRFAGWGGLQPEGDDVDLALVLHPRYWGIGRAIYEQIIPFAFEQMKFPSLTILFPPTRTRIKGILRLGFVRDGEVDIAGERFLRYRLNAPATASSGDPV